MWTNRPSEFSCTSPGTFCKVKLQQTASTTAFNPPDQDADTSRNGPANPNPNPNIISTIFCRVPAALIIKIHGNKPKKCVFFTLFHYLQTSASLWLREPTTLITFPISCSDPGQTVQRGSRPHSETSSRDTGTHQDDPLVLQSSAQNQTPFTSGIHFLFLNGFMVFRSESGPT